MFDLHYDLLTNILIRQNDITNLKRYCNKIYNKENIIGGFFNLFYMSPNEMKDDLNISYEDIDLIENLRTVNKIINKYNLIPKDIKYIYGIEGLDYLKTIEDIDLIYELGVRSVNIVWNNENKFGTGIKGPEGKGLTTMGKELVEKLVSRNIAIDLSHANTKTFYDIIKQCEKLKSKGNNPIVFASHSNAKSVCNVNRNLTDNQILKIKQLDGIIGIVSIKNFCLDNNNILKNNSKYKQAYINNIDYVKNTLSNVDNIALSSDDMTYYKIQAEYYQNINIFKQNKIRKQICKLLKEKHYSNDEILKIMNQNAKNKLFDKILYSP